MITWEDYKAPYVFPKTWEDTSWGNDELPSFEVNGYKIWVNSPDEAERLETGTEDWIFAITYCSERGALVLRNSLGADEDLLTTMDFDEAVVFVHRMHATALKNENN
jgi:hypothetical protein